jgi:transmembrane sensor
MNARSQNPRADEEASVWAARLEGSTLSADDRVALENWLAADPSHRTLLTSYCQFSADLEQQLPLLAGIKEGSAGRRTRAPTTALPLPWLRWPMLAGVALTAVAAVVFLYRSPEPAAQEISVATPIAQRQSHVLPDGTRMDVNAHTAIVVQFDAGERRVRLASGQAFFSVAKDPGRPFVVETPRGAVRVTGTRFDVQASADAFTVTVAEGSVQVRPRRLRRSRWGRATPSPRRIPMASRSCPTRNCRRGSRGGTGMRFSTAPR